MKNYFERLLNAEDGREAVISTVGMRGKKILRDREDESIVKKEVRKAIKENERC